VLLILHAVLLELVVVVFVVLLIHVVVIKVDGLMETVVMVGRWLYIRVIVAILDDY